MKNKTLAYLLVLLAFNLSLQAQLVTSTIKTDDPEFAGIMIRPNITTEVGGKAFGMSYGLEAEFRKDIIPIHVRASYYKSYLGNHSALTSDLFMGDKEAIQSIEFGIEYPLINKTKVKPIGVAIDAQDVSSTTVSVTYLTRDGSVNRQVLPRVGLYSHRSYWHNQDNTDSTFVNNINLNNATQTLEGNFTANGIYIGIGTIKKVNLVLDVVDFGLSRETGYSHIYADLILTPNISLGEWTDQNALVGAAGTVYDIKDASNLEYKTLGYRLGWIANFVNSKNERPNGWYFKLEGGMRPALIDQNWFFLAAFGYQFNIK